MLKHVVFLKTCTRSEPRDALKFADLEVGMKVVLEKSFTSDIQPLGEPITISAIDIDSVWSADVTFIDINPVDAQGWCIATDKELDNGKIVLTSWLNG